MRLQALIAAAATGTGLGLGLGLGLASPALAEQHGIGPLYELKLGVLAHDVGGLWSGFNQEDGVDINVEAIFSPATEVLWGVLRPALGASINSAGDTSLVYLDARWEHAWSAGPYVALGIGAAVHDGKLEDGHHGRKALGSRVLFHFPLEIGYRVDGHHGLSAYFDHVSNAWLADENEGMDTLGVRYGYRF